MNIYKIYAVIGPWTTPAPAAIALAGQVYGEVADSSWIVGVPLVVFTLAAAEVVGGLCTKSMLKASSQKNWKRFWVMFLGVAAYAGLGIWALWGVTAWIYVVLAVFVHIAVTGEQADEQKKTEATQAHEAKLAQIREETKRINAETRLIKASRPGLDMSPVSSERSVNTEQCRPDVQSLLDKEPGLSAREVGRRLNISTTTASKHKKLWENSNADL